MPRDIYIYIYIYIYIHIYIFFLDVYSAFNCSLTITAFRYKLSILKFYSIRDVNYKFSVLAVNIRTRLIYHYIAFLHVHLKIYIPFIPFCKKAIEKIT